MRVDLYEFGEEGKFWEKKTSFWDKLRGVE